MPERFRVFSDFLNCPAASSPGHNNHARKDQERRSNYAPAKLLTQEDRRQSKRNQRLQINVDSYRTRRQAPQRPRVQIIAASRRPNDDGNHCITYNTTYSVQRNVTKTEQAAGDRGYASDYENPCDDRQGAVAIHQVLRSEQHTSELQS